MGGAHLIDGMLLFLNAALAAKDNWGRLIVFEDILYLAEKLVIVFDVFVQRFT